MTVRVYYEDTDAGGIVYHTNYIKYCERARSELFFSQGKLPKLDANSGFVVRRLTCDYLATATLGDLLEVTTTIETMKHSSISLRQEVFKGETKLFSASILLVYIEEGKPRRIPETLRELFTGIQ
jgi:acyl-CoA thioester hydrolase